MNKIEKRASLFKNEVEANIWLKKLVNTLRILREGKLFLRSRVDFLKIVKSDAYNILKTI